MSRWRVAFVAIGSKDASLMPFPEELKSELKLGWSLTLFEKVQVQQSEGGFLLQLEKLGLIFLILF